MKKLSMFWMVVSFALLGAVALARPGGSGYHLIKKVPLGAAPGGKGIFRLRHGGFRRTAGLSGAWRRGQSDRCR